MAHIHCDLRSECLDMQTAIQVVLPESVDVHSAKVIYLLHGRADNCSGWYRFTSVERYARMKNLVLVTPEVQRSFYTDMEMGIPYFQYISEELPQLCRNMFHLSAKQEDNYIMGLSMGGYGALKCALTHPDRYAGVAVFSAVTDIQEFVQTGKKDQLREFAAIFGPELKIPERDDLWKLAETVTPETFPRILTCCGEEDSLFPMNRAFAAQMREKGFSLTFEHWPGEHNWIFWDRAVDLAIATFFPEEGK